MTPPPHSFGGGWRSGQLYEGILNVWWLSPHVSRQPFNLYCCATLFSKAHPIPYSRGTPSTVLIDCFSLFVAHHSFLIVTCSLSHSSRLHSHGSLFLFLQSRSLSPCLRDSLWFMHFATSFSPLCLEIKISWFFVSKWSFFLSNYFMLQIFQ